ncbi:MAG: PKD domain-containing protein, partial [Bacteroidia bacterium]
SGATTYTWNGGITDGTPFTPSSGTYTFIVNGTDGNGCTNKDSVVVLVNATPTVSAGADQSVCVGSSVTLTGSGATTYTWNGGITDGTPFTPAVGSYTYTVNGTDANGCTNKDSAVVTVNATPTVSAGADQSVCVGNPITLSGSGAATYTWSGGITDGTPFTPTAGSYTYVVNGTDANGCTGKDSAYVTVYILPPVNAGGDLGVCEGTSVTLSASGATTYTWNGGVTDGTPFTPTTGSYTYVVNGTDANGCTNKDSVYVTINPTPTVSAGADQAICAGTTVTLSGSGASTYTWNGGVTNGTPFTPAVGSYTYTVNGTDANGCTNKDSVTVTVNATPTVSAGPMLIMPCGDLTDTLNSSTNAVNPSYSWNGPGIVSGGTTATPIVNTTGIYTVTVTDLTTGCSDTSSVVVITNTMSVSFTPDVTSGYSPLSVNFTNTSIGANTFNWTFGNGSGSTTTNAGTTYNTSGTYTVELIGYNATGCSDTARATIMVLDNSSITAPNVFSPNGDNINDVYFFATVGIESLSADLFNRWGEKIGRINGVNDGWDGKTPKGVDASEGTYYYILKAKGFDGKNYELHGAFTLVK